MLIPSFGVSMTILNPVDFFLLVVQVWTVGLLDCWTVGHFGLLQDQVKSCCFFGKNRDKETIFLLFAHIYWNNWLKMTLENPFGY